MADALTFLKQLPHPDTRTLQHLTLKPLTANTHIHLPPNFSAFQSVSQAVKLASEQGLRVLGAGNYYDFSVYDVFSEQCREAGIFPLFGTETIAFEPELAERNIRINDPGNPGKIYLCGKGITAFSPLSSPAAEQMTRIRRDDAARMKAMIDKLTGLFHGAGISLSLDEQAVIGRVVRRHGCRPETVTLQERHIAQAFQEVFFEHVPEERRGGLLANVYGCTPKAAANDAVGTQNDIRSFLMKAGKAGFVPESFGRLSEAQSLICKLGGIPCYPVLADGAATPCEYEMSAEALVERLKDNGYAMAEFIPTRNRPDAMTAYATAIRKAGIVLAAGTEHNTLDLSPLTPVCAGGAAVPSQLAEWFWEGVCVVAAHQYLCANGQTGFVDGQGRPNTDFADAEQRIESFARLGQVVLDSFFKGTVK